ncbi:MAG: LacI family DNA-binding transcriptional regulator [Planctomycetes bacterium]|nr:LacI family DNA-binding transcriptional regulator [Planctomycetota bacterium]
MPNSDTNTPVTMLDVAKRAHCSRAAVSHVLMGTGQGVIKVGKETAAGIRRAAGELKFHPNHAARQLAGKRSRLLGVIADDWSSATGVRIFTWLEKNAAERDYQVLTSQTGNDPRRFERSVATCLSRGVEGVVCVGYRSEEQWAEVGPLLARFPHVVSVFARPNIPGVEYVDIDAAEATRQSVTHLLDRGRKRIGLLLEDLDLVPNRQRHEAFLQTHRELGLPVDEKRIYVGTKDWYYDRPEFEQQIDGALDRLLGEGRADALLADDDYGAAVLIRGLSRRGLRVPEDVAVVGYGNHLVSHFLNPELTTIDIRVQEVVYTAVAMLTEAIDGPESGSMQSVTLRPELLVRKSS